MKQGIPELYGQSFSTPSSQLLSHADFQFVAFGQLHMNIFSSGGQHFQGLRRISRD